MLSRVFHNSKKIIETSITFRRYKSQISNTWKIEDVIHGSIELPPHIITMVDTYEFQRLQYISQMGLNKFVFPGTIHSRYEHSIGTFYLSSIVLQNLKDQISKEGLDFDLTKDDVKCVEIAALYHDIGHGPYSHIWDKQIIQNFVEKHDRVPHERNSVEIFLFIVNNPEYKIKEKLRLKEDMIRRICRLILGEPDEKLDKGKHVLFEIVSNKWSGLDVDRIDYLCRDSLYTGFTKINLYEDVKRLIQLIRLVKDSKTKEWCLAIRDKDLLTVVNLLYQRYFIHNLVNYHTRVLFIECLFRDSMKLIINDPRQLKELLQSVIGEEIYEISPKILCKSDFIKQSTEYHVWRVLSKYGYNLKERIQTQDLYKFIACLKQTIQFNSMARTDLPSLVKDLETSLRMINPNSVQITISYFSLGPKNINPFLHIFFYNKHDTKTGFRYRDDQCPYLLKQIYNTVQINIFMVGSQEFERRGFSEYIDKWCIKHDFQRVHLDRTFFL